MDTDIGYSIKQGSVKRAIIFCNLLPFLAIRDRQVCLRPIVDLIIEPSGTSAILAGPALNKLANVDLGPGGHDGNLPVEEIESDPDNGSPLCGFHGGLRLQGGGELPNKRVWR